MTTEQDPVRELMAASYANINDLLGTSNFKMIFKSTPDSCFLVEINGEEFYMPRDTFRSNMHTIHGMHKVIDGSIRMITEVELMDWTRPRLPSGGLFLDVGAMGGVISLPVSRMHGGNVRVIAFEPARSAIFNLKRAIEVNNVTNVELVTKAVSSSAGTVEFGEIGFQDNEAQPWLSQTSSIMHDAIDPRVKTYAVETITLDGFFKDRSDRTEISAIKIDVEGFEVDVIAGAMEILAEVRPPITIDIHAHPYQAGDTDQPIRDQLAPLGYTFTRENHVLLCEPVAP